METVDVCNRDRMFRCVWRRGRKLMQKYSFGLTDLTSFEKPAGEYTLDAANVARRGRLIAKRLAHGFPDAVIAGLCVVAFDAAGNLATVVPLATVH
jgi:hypothetical protein